MVKCWQQFLLGKFFVIQIDHWSLKELMCQVMVNYGLNTPLHVQTTLKHNNIISNYTLNLKHYTLNHTNNFIYYLFNLKSLLFYILLTSLSCQNELLIYFQLKNLLCFLYPVFLHIDTPSIYSPFSFLLHTNRRTMCCVWVSFGLCQFHLLLHWHWPR